MTNDLYGDGRFFKAESGNFYFSRSRRRIYQLDPRDSSLSAFIDDRYGVNSAEKREYEHIVVGLFNYTENHGESVSIHRLAHYDTAAKTLYVSRFDGFIYRLDGSTVTLLPNGTDGIFFFDQPGWQPYEISQEVPMSNLFPDLIINSANFSSTGALSLEEQRWLFQVWIFSIFFGSLHPTKPLVLFVGEKGGGKTHALKKVLKLLFGRHAQVTALERSKSDGFISAVTSEAVLVIDNVDEHIPWLPDHLAQFATGAKIARRELYTTNERKEFVPECFIALTSRTPKFIEDRDDVLDRTLIFNTERREHFLPENQLLNEVLANRNVLMTELIHRLNRLVGFFRVRGQFDGPVDFRMADFGTFAISVAQQEGKKEYPEQIFRKMATAQTHMLLEDEPLVRALEIWLREPSNHGRTMSSADLLPELSAVAGSNEINWPYSTPHALGQKLKNIKSNLQMRFRIEDETDSSNKRLYRFWPKGSESV